MEKKTIEMLNGVKLNESVSHGTLNQYDLFCAFSNVLRVTDEWDAMMSENIDILRGTILAAVQNYNDPWWSTDSARDTVECLIDTLDTYAPEGYYFGPHQGNTSDYGFWSLHYTVWVGGVEVTDHYISLPEARDLANNYRLDGYDDVRYEQITL